MAGRTPLMAGNWKMNLNHLEAIAHVQKIAYTLNEEDFQNVEVAVLTPFTDIRSVQTLVDGDKLKIRYGAQDVSVHDKGAYTGETSGAMLERLGCSYVCVGHSERRQYHGETDDIVNAKAKAALRFHITPIVCVGEGLEIRKSGTHVRHTLEQLDASLADLTAEQVSELVVAYEPVWAIGTGETASVQDAQEVCAAIRQRIGEVHGSLTADKVRILYGGSVKSTNVASLMAAPDIDGALVGGASLDPDEFVALVRFRLHPVD